MLLRKFGLSRWSFSSALFLAGALSGAVVTGAVMADQPHMQAALQSLYAARQQLNAALSDKAGHRVNALNLVNRAISETQAGIAAGRR